MELVELTPLSGALVGLPGVDGLSTEQRKRLTIAVELVANPSIVFMDEPTSGLDARAAAIVMRTVRNIVNTGRTIVCTIHQPSIDIFESFDEVFFLGEGISSVSFKIENLELSLLVRNITSPSLPFAYFDVDR
jgi:ABC-type multidrug transport system ATPase subunit